MDANPEAMGIPLDAWVVKIAAPTGRRWIWCRVQASAVDGGICVRWGRDRSGNARGHALSYGVTTTLAMGPLRTLPPAAYLS